MYNPRNKELVLVFIFALLFVASGADLLADLSHGANSGHIVQEAIVVGLSILAISWLLFGLHQQRLEIKALLEELETANNPKPSAKRYVLEARKQLGSVVSQQFSDWQLTGSEIEVAWLLLKGFSLKEIAIVRNTQEKTVRQQASSIYKKAGVNGRHAFSAWFIEDML